MTIEASVWIGSSTEITTRKAVIGVVMDAQVSQSQSSTNLIFRSW